MMCRCYRELGDTFKWLFYGDDDTMWLRPNPDLLVQAYDANKPHVLTGEPGTHPSCCCLAAIAGLDFSSGSSRLTHQHSNPELKCYSIASALDASAVRSADNWWPDNDKIMRYTHYGPRCLPCHLKPVGGHLALLAGSRPCSWG